MPACLPACLYAAYSIALCETMTVSCSHSRSRGGRRCRARARASAHTWRPRCWLQPTRARRCGGATAAAETTPRSRGGAQGCPLVSLSVHGQRQRSAPRPGHQAHALCKSFSADPLQQRQTGPSSQAIAKLWHCTACSSWCSHTQWNLQAADHNHTRYSLLQKCAFLDLAERAH